MTLPRSLLKPLPGNGPNCLTAITPVRLVGEIMGSNFVSVDDMSRHFDVYPKTPEQETRFAYVPWPTGTLEQCQDTHLLLAYGGFSITDMMKQHTELLHLPALLHPDSWTRMPRWYGYHLIRLKPEPLDGRVEENYKWCDVCIIVYAMLMQKLVHGSWLFEDTWVQGRRSEFSADVYAGKGRRLSIMNHASIHLDVDLSRIVERS
jgi:hypothetical protein